MELVNTAQEPDTDKKFLSADDILSANDIDTLEVEVPEWGGTLCFLAMNGDEAIQFNQNFKNPSTKDDALIRLFVLSAVNNPIERKRIFTEAKVTALRKKKFGVFLRLQDKLLAFNGFGEAAKAAAKND